MLPVGGDRKNLPVVSCAEKSSVQVGGGSCSRFARRKSIKKKEISLPAVRKRNNSARLWLWWFFFVVMKATAEEVKESSTHKYEE